MDRLGGLVVFMAPASTAGDPGSIPGPGENFFSKIIIIIITIGKLFVNLVTFIKCLLLLA